MHTYIHTCMHIHVHTYTYTYTYTYYKAHGEISDRFVLCVRCILGVLYV
jgi:hypothetical protein